MEKEPKIDLPKPLHEHVEAIHRKLDFFSESNPIRRWAGYDLIDVIFYLYLFNKYKNNCLIKYKGVTSKNALGVELQIKQRMTKIDKIIYMEHLNTVANQLANCIKREPTNIVIPLYLKTPNGGHANVLIYRKNGNVIEHFEPHGKKYSRRDEKINDLIDKKLDEFINILNGILKKNKKNPLTLVKSTDVCPANVGLQGIEAIATSKKLRLEGGGYCAAWSMFFTELALKNPSISSNELLNIVYNKLKNIDIDNKSEVPVSPDYLRKVIIGYINLVYQKIEKYFSFMLGQKVTVEKLTEMIKKGTHKEFITNFKTLIDIEMELLNNPSLTKEQYLRILQNKETNTTNPDEIDNIQKQINMLERMNLLLNPSPQSGVREVIQKSKSPKTRTSSKSITKKKRKTPVEIEEIVVDEMIDKSITPNYSPKSPDYASLSPDYVPKSADYAPISPDYPPSEKKSPQKKGTPIELESISSVSSFVITPNCPEGKVFDQIKGRCVKIKQTKKKEITPLKPVQIQPVTTVIKKSSPKAKTKKLKPCPEGEERNPETGRCKKIKVYPPCPEGQIRDPITHRCRKQK